MTRKKKRNWAIIIGFIGVLATLSGIILNYAINNAPPKIEIGQYQSEPYVIVSTSSVPVTVRTNNQTTTSTNINQTVHETQGYNLYNITYEIRNTGKQTAHNILVTGSVEPSNNCSITSTYVYTDSPLPSNLVLKTVDKPYSTSFLGVGESLIFRFEMKDGNLFGQTTFNIKVISDDAGSLTKQLIFNY